MCSFPQHLAEFDSYLEAIGRAARTRHHYRRHLVNFWCDYLYGLEGVTLATLTEAQVVAYWRLLPAQGSTRGDATRALRAFFGWMDGRYRDGNPAAPLRIPRSRVGPAPRLPDEKLRPLLRAAFAQGARRGWAMMFLLATGARIGSFVAMRPDDLVLDDPKPYVYFTVAKGDRPYKLRLSRRGRIAARHLLALSTGPTVVGVGAERIRQWMHQAELEAGVGRVWPHLLRHEFSNRTARSGDPEAWRKAMNHRDLSQWPRYNNGEEDRVASAVEW